jgi:hypothetical protein
MQWWQIALHSAAEAPAGAVFHHEEQGTLFDEVMIEGHYPRMMKLIQRFHLVNQASLIIGGAVLKSLDSDLAAKKFVFRQVNIPESAASQPTENPILRIEFVACVDSHGI